MPKRVLIVDDEPHVLEGLKFRLEKLGYEILTAVDGGEALELIRDEKPDLVLLDLRIPTMGGDEVCRRVKEDEELRQIPVILCTASGADVIVEKAREAKSDDYLLKPFAYKELLEKVEKLTR